MTNHKPPIERSLKMALIIAVLVTGAVVTFTVLAQMKMDSDRNALLDRIFAGQSDRWTRTDMRNWAEKLRDDNPGVIVPSTERRR